MQPLNHDYMPNLKKNIWPMLARPLLRQGSHYTVPYTVYLHRHRLAHGHGQRRHRCDGQPLGSFWDPEYKGIAGLYDDYRETIGVGMYRNGITDINGDKTSDLEAARESLVELTDLINIRYTIDGAYAKLPEGMFGIHHAWSGDMVNAPYYMPKGGDPSVLRYVWPPKAQGGAGGYVSNDNLAVLKDAERPRPGPHVPQLHAGRRSSIKNFCWNAYQPPLKSLDPDSMVDGGGTREPGVDGNRAGGLRGGPDATAADAGAGRALARGVVEGPAGRLGP